MSLRRCARRPFARFLARLLILALVAALAPVPVEASYTVSSTPLVTKDELGNRVSQQDANLHTTSFEYDKLGRETKRTLPDASFETKTYDLAGNLKTSTDFRGRTTTFDYDLNRRLLTKTYADSTSVTFTYTVTGRRKTATDNRGTTSYGYDLRDRLTSMTYPGGNKLEYIYDANGNRTSLNATIGASSYTTTYGYDDLSRLQTATDLLNRTSIYDYDANGNRESLLQPNGTSTSYVYNSLNRLTDLTTTGVAGLVQGYAFTLGAAGNRERIDETGGISRAYDYDELYRLTDETVTIGGANQYGKVFEYDPVGNRRTQTTTIGPAGTPSAALQAGVIDYGYDTRDRLLTETGIAGGYGYDTNGNLTTKAGDTSYTWDFDNRLTRVTTTAGLLVEHAYDADGNRVQTRTTLPAQTTQEANFLVDTSGGLSHVVAETSAANALTALYVRGLDDLLEVMRPDGSGGWTTRYYHADGIGSVRRLTDEAGATTDTYTYSAFGELLEHTGTDTQPYSFAGEPYDPNVGFQYHRARWMDPNVGRFLGMDLWEGNAFEPMTLHRYLYAGVDPVNKVDPSGRFSLATTITIAVIGAALAGAISGYRQGGAGLAVERGATWAFFALVIASLAIDAVYAYPALLALQLRPPPNPTLPTLPAMRRFSEEGTTPVLARVQQLERAASASLVQRATRAIEKYHRTWDQKLLERGGNTGNFPGGLPPRNLAEADLNTTQFLAEVEGALTAEELSLFERFLP